MPSQLPIHEWCIILLFCLILLILAAFALGGQKQLPAPHSLAVTHSFSESQNTVIQAKIEGEVAKPGFYRLSFQTSIKELLEQAEVLPQADLSQLKVRRYVKDGEIIRIPKRQWITIHLTGAVLQPGPFKVLSGTRCCELIVQLELLPEANSTALNKKRGFLQEGDYLDIPFKKKKKKIDQ